MRVGVGVIVGAHTVSWFGMSWLTRPDPSPGTASVWSASLWLMRIRSRRSAS